MAPSLVTIGTAALALAGDVAAKKFSLADTYDSTNFFSKFTFFESNYNTSNYNDVDPTSGYINYRSQADAQALGLASTAGGEIYLGLDAKSITQFPGVGRSSVRLESKEVYNKALIVARFSHLPKPVCGAWPAFWSYGSPWPTKGELDWFEGWNLNKVNKPAAHTYKSSEQGQCLISSTGQTAQVDTPNCDQEAPNQYSNQGCTTSTTSSDPYGSSDGGVYAVEWTDDYIKFFSWRWGSVPDNVNSDSPDTATWGTPSMLIANDACNINSHFKDQRLVINIGMCGVLAGNDGVWGSECKAATGHAVCSTYAATNPSAFSDTYFKVKDIRIFKEGGQTSSTTSVIPAPTPVVSSSSVVQLTTSTVFTTQVSTVTSCAPTVTNCPVGAVVTKTIALYTTVCPVTAAVKTTSAKGNGKASTKVNKSNTTKATTKVNKNTTKPTTKTTPPGVRTTVLTKTYTITKCPSSVPNCPIGSVTTKVTTKVITPTPKTTPKTTTKPANGGSNNKVSTKVYTTTYTITKCPASVPNCPIGSVTTKTVTKVTTPGVPATPKTTPATKVTKVITVSTTPAKTTGGSNTNKSNNSNNGGGSNTNKSNNGNTYSNSTTAVTKSSTVSSAKASGTAPGASTTVCSGASCPATTKPVITNNAVQAGVSFALMAVGAFAVFVL
ncbi:hypothetical protein K4K60_002510 [Colletotrichum sp. SAR11_57]|nr:hypothetical protein K4K60_002510 [Colletotrichum sp. SAR11_57]